MKPLRFEDPAPPPPNASNSQQGEPLSCLEDLVGFMRCLEFGLGLLLDATAPDLDGPEQ